MLLQALYALLLPPCSKPIRSPVCALTPTALPNFETFRMIQGYPIDGKEVLPSGYNLEIKIKPNYELRTELC